MKKVYLFSLCTFSLATVVLFQNCSKVKMASDVSDPAVLEAAKDPGVITFDESAKFSVTSTLFQEDNFRILYEYKVSGGFRPPCNYSDEALEGAELRCSNASGFRVLSDGSLVTFYQFFNQKEIQYHVGYFGERQFQALLKKSSQIIQAQSKFIDLNPDGPTCMDAPSVEQSLFTENGTVFNLAKFENCHKYIRQDEGSAAELSNSMERLYRRISSAKTPKKQVLIESTLQGGFRPYGMPLQNKIQIQSDGRVLRSSFYADQSKNNTVLVEILSHSDLANLNKQLKEIQGQFIALKDTEEGAPICADAPRLTYSLYENIPRPCPPPPQGTQASDIMYRCGEEAVKIDFAIEENCHSFRDSKLIYQSQSLIKFIDQFSR